MKVRIMFTFVFALASLGMMAMSATVYSSHLIEPSMMPYVSAYMIAGSILFGVMTKLVISPLVDDKVTV